MLNYIKLPPLRAYLSTDKFDVICISVTYIDSDTSHENANLEIVGYTLIRAVHSSDTKWGGAYLLLQTFPRFPIIKYSVFGGMHKFWDMVCG